MMKKVGHHKIKILKKNQKDSYIIDSDISVIDTDLFFDLLWPSMTSEVTCHSMKKMCHHKMNILKIFQKDSYINESASSVIDIDIFHDLLWPSMTS